MPSVFWIGIIIIIFGEAAAIIAELFTAKYGAGGVEYTNGNIWLISVASITSILIVEPLVAYLVFHEMPTRGTVIGLILGVLGFISTLTIK